jgi:3-oxoacyl-[acyl-carrier-protein] synthase-3
MAIRGTGSYTPDRIVTNEHFISYLDTSDEWIVTRTGIRRRHWASPQQATSDLGAEAARRAIADAGLTVQDIDCIICATATGDHPFPATACFIQHLIGAEPVPAFDVGAACAGFLYACNTAVGFISTGAFRNVLAIGAETLSRYGDPEDRSTCVLFGDGAGAAVWSRAEEPGPSILYSEFGTDGSRTDHIVALAGGSRLFASPVTTAERLHYLRMKGREVYKFAVLKMGELIDRALAETGLRPDDLKLVIPHQSNARIIESTRERLGLPPEKVVLNIGEYGNTSAASIPIALDDARRSGAVKAGDAVLMIALGAGLTWGVILIRL